MTFFAEFRVEVGAPISLGNDGFGDTRIVPIMGGIVTGETLSGTILPGGADEQRIRADGLVRLHARYVIRASNGALIRVDCQGLRHAPPALSSAMLRGEVIDHTQVYFRTVIRFEASDTTHEDLNRALFLAEGRRMADHVLLRLTRV